ncbi:MAG TPA: hypothetical protein VHB21_03215, partial [Minicystis sp.]|nr:hypothetical protein [Minicystis sp.]
GDVNPVGVGGFGGTFSSSDVNPVGVGGFGVGGASNVAASVGPGPGSTGTGSTACQSTSCVQNSNGDCSCKGSCPDGSIVRVQCMNEPGGSMCNCFHGGMFVGSCGSVVPQCDVPHSCCAQFL